MIGRRNTDGSEVSYLHLAHNEWDPEQVVDRQGGPQLRPRGSARSGCAREACALALLLMPIAENQTGDTGRNLRREIERLPRGRFRGSAGIVEKTSEPTAAQRRILRALSLEPPPAFPAVDLAA